LAYNPNIAANELQATPVAQQPVRERIVIKNAALSLVVENPDEKVSQISALAEGFGGWVVTASIQHGRADGSIIVTSASVTIRVLADRLNEALAQIKDGAESIQSETVTGQDVTQDYVDLNSRLTNLEAAEVQLQAIMDSANRTEDVLNVYNELVRIRGEIESIRGQIRYYDESAAYSSIQVNLIPARVTQPVEIAGWRPLDTVRDAFQVLLNVLRFAVDLAIVAIVLVVPLLIVFGLPARLIYRRYRQRTALRQKPVPDPTTNT